MKKIGMVSLVLSFLALGLLPRTASAQAEHVSIDIPFDFMVENTKLPAGTYEISRVRTWDYRIATPRGDQTALFTTQTVKNPTRAATFTLYFNVYGDTYYLAKFFHQGEYSGYQLAPTEAEKALAAKIPVTVKTVTRKNK